MNLIYFVRYKHKKCGLLVADDSDHDTVEKFSKNGAKVFVGVIDRMKAER